MIAQMKVASKPPSNLPKFLSLNKKETRQQLYDVISEANRSPQLYTTTEPAHDFEGQGFNYVSQKKAGAEEETEPVNYGAEVDRLARDSLSQFEGLAKDVDEKRPRKIDDYDRL